MEELTSRERVRLALNHQETDRVPIDFGGKISGIALSTFNELKALMNIKSDTKILDTRLQLARVDEDILDKFSVDTRYVYQRPAKSWDPKRNYADDTYVDEWGITLGKPQEGYYYDYVKSPLANAETPRDLEEYEWPNVEDLSRNEGLIDELKAMAKTKAPFIITSFKGTFEQAWALRGLEQFLMDLIINRDFAEALLDKVFEVQKKLYGPFFELIAPYIDMVCFTDDMGGQGGPLISPKIYREIVKPRHKKMVQFIKERTDGALIALHCCGSVVEFLQDFCDIGAEVLNPVQVTATGMDIKYLKEEVGEKLSFWGAIDTQQLLPFGTPEDVRRAVAETCRVLGKGGGYLFAPVHNIQPQTPAENVLALFEG